jgi:hypothetical protein
MEPCRRQTAPEKSPVVLLCSCAPTPENSTEHLIMFCPDVHKFPWPQRLPGPGRLVFDATGQED